MRTARTLARVTGQSLRRLRHLLRPGDRAWVELVRQTDPKLAARVKALGLAGIEFVETQRRDYPQGAVTCHVIGLTTPEGRGLFGAERLFDEELRGEPGTVVRIRDAKGRLITPMDAPRKPASDGHDVVLTLDAALQTYLSDALNRLVSEFKPKGAVGILLEASTGRILAMASRPDFHPGRRTGLTSDLLVNRAIQHAYEPGSTFKPFVWAAVLEAGLARPGETIFCENGQWRIGGRVLHDSHAYGELSVVDGLVYSSNIMAAKLGRRLGAERLHAAITAFGFGAPTGLGLAGESRGLLRPVSRWTPIYSITSLPMGQEILVTPLQIVMAYGAIANGGVLMSPALLDRIVDSSGTVLYRQKPQVVRRVVRPETAGQVLDILTEAVRRGTGRRAAIQGYAIAGKTGTAQKAIPGRRGYAPDRWVSSFVGMAPAGSSRLVCLVLVDEPQGAHTGGRVAAPAVRRILERALRHLGVPPRSVAGSQ